MNIEFKAGANKESGTDHYYELLKLYVKAEQFIYKVEKSIGDRC